MPLARPVGRLGGDDGLSVLSLSADDVADRLGTRTGPRRAGLFLWWLPLLAAAVAGAVVYAWTASHDDVYRARVALLVPAESSLPPESYAGLAVSGPVLREVIQSLRLDLSVDELADDVRVSNSGLLLEVEVDAPTPAMPKTAPGRWPTC